MSAADLDQGVETTAYYVAAEAITNAVKHAEATSITLDVDIVAGQLHVRVTDDGNGRAAPRPGLRTRRPRRPCRRTRRAAVDPEQTRRRHHHRSDTSVRIVIAEDSTLFREGLASLLTDAEHDIVARVPDATTLMEAVRDHHPDLAIVDVRMPPDHTDDGARAATALRATYPGWASCCSPNTSRPHTQSTSSAPEPSATSSRTACSTSTTSWTPSSASPPEVPPSTPRSSDA